jgi:hypothetical protein
MSIFGALLISSSLECGAINSCRCDRLPPCRVSRFWRHKPTAKADDTRQESVDVYVLTINSASMKQNRVYIEYTFEYRGNRNYVPIFRSDNDVKIRLFVKNSVEERLDQIFLNLEFISRKKDKFVGITILDSVTKVPEYVQVEILNTLSRPTRLQTVPGKDAGK